MKNIKFLSVVLAIVAAFAVFSCTTTQGTADENYDRSRVGEYEVTRQVGNRLYIDDPYRGTIILQRDPYSGRYYDVTNSYGFSSPYNSYGNRGYRNYNNNTYYRNNTPRSSTPVTQQPTQQRSEEWQKQREEARKKVLGN